MGEKYRGKAKQKQEGKISNNAANTQLQTKNKQKHAPIKVPGICSRRGAMTFTTQIPRTRSTDFYLAESEKEKERERDLA